MHLGRIGDCLRDGLKDAGVTRMQLFERSNKRLRLRAHDLRATFVTLSLANGKTEDWVRTRTGHKSSLMIARYRRDAHTVEELGLGWLHPLHEAIPELARIDSAGATKPAVVDDHEQRPSEPAQPQPDQRPLRPQLRIVGGRDVAKKGSSRR